MNCAGFEQALVEALAGPLDAPLPPETLRRLRTHTRACEACAGAAVLLDWIELPPAERGQAVRDPGERYWSSFDTRLRKRLHDVRRRRRAAWTRAAAALAALGWLGWWLSTPRAPRPVDLPANGVPESLMRLIESRGAEEALRAVDLVIGDEGPTGSAWDVTLDPAVERGREDAELRRELLQWLRERTASSKAARS